MSLRTKILNTNEPISGELKPIELDLKLIKDIKRNLSGQSKDKKAFLKFLFKVYDNNLKNFKEDDFINLTKLLDCREIEKIVLALKYKENLNYREKANIVKQLTKDFSVEYFFVLDNIIRSYWNDFTNAKFKISNLPNLKENYDGDDETFFNQLSILVNVMTLIRCVKYDYYNSSITAIDNNYKIKKAITPNKILGCIGPILIVGDIEKCDNIDILDCAQNLGSVYGEAQALSAIMQFIGFISVDEVTEDIYSKIVLKDEYNETVTNRIHNTSLITYADFNIKDFLKRKILLPKNGVILLVKDVGSCIESILIKEKLGTYYNNLVVVTRYKNGYEVINTLIIKEWKFSNDVRNLNVYNIEQITSTPNTADYLSAFFELYDDNHYKYKPNFEVIAPYYWRYRHKNYKSENDVLNDKGLVVKREFSIDVAPFIRKIKGEAGKEANQLADKLGVILEPGYTIVKAHNRVYNKVNK